MGAFHEFMRAWGAAAQRERPSGAAVQRRGGLGPGRRTTRAVCHCRSHLMDVNAWPELDRPRLLRGRGGPDAHSGSTARAEDCGGRHIVGRKSISRCPRFCFAASLAAKTPDNHNHAENPRPGRL
jgi:hypothetical protein